MPAIGRVLGTPFARRRKAFTPKSIAGLQLWLDASTISGSDGDAVGTWSDLSGNGRNATQSTALAKPVLKTNIVNGRAVVRFDGVDDFVSGAVAITGSTYTLFAVALVKNAASSYGRIVSLAVASTATADWNTTPYSVLQRFPGNLMMGYRSSSGLSRAALSYDTNTLWTSQFTGSQHVLYKNGAAQTAYSSSGSFSVTTFRLAVDSQLGQWLSCDLAEIALYSGSLSSTDRGKVEEYLRAKYALY